MRIEVANRLAGIGEYYFSQKLAEIGEMNKRGCAVINLGIGSPDLPPHPDVVRVLHEESAKSATHAYQSYRGSEVLRIAFAGWYNRWYGVRLDAATEVLPLIGSKEGIVHLCMAYLNPGDAALIPNPGYPTYSSAVKLAGGECIPYSLKEERAWQIDFDELESQDLSRVKLMWVNYPHMPTGTLPTKELFERIVAFGKRNNILICHDNPYSFILNDNPASLLCIDGAKDVAVELNSLSKSSNMAGWRVGVLCGAKERINEVLRFKSNMDSGMFLPVQLAAAKALMLGKEWYDELNAVYRKRREKVYALLRLLGCLYSTQQAGLFVWARVPAEYRNGYELSDEVLQSANVFITPGGIFGSEGDGYVRVSLCATEAVFEQAIERIEQNRRR